MHEWAMRISEFELGYWAKGPLVNTSKFQQSPTNSHWHISSFKFQNIVLYTGILVETVKLNFHLELHATLVHNLNSGLCLELQVFCELASHKVLTDTRLPKASPRVELIRHTPWPFMSLLESTQLS